MKQHTCAYVLLLCINTQKNVVCASQSFRCPSKPVGMSNDCRPRKRPPEDGFDRMNPLLETNKPDTQEYKRVCEREYKNYMEPPQFNTVRNPGIIMESPTTTAMMAASTSPQDLARSYIRPAFSHIPPIFICGTPLPPPAYQGVPGMVKFYPLYYLPSLTYNDRDSLMVPATTTLLYFKANVSREQAIVLDLLWQIGVSPLKYFRDVLLIEDSFLIEVRPQYHQFMKLMGLKIGMYGHVLCKFHQRWLLW